MTDQNKLGKYKKLYRRFTDTPLGTMIAMASDSGLCFLEFAKPERHVFMERRLNKYFAAYEIIDGPSSFIDAAEEWLRNYFAKGALRVPPLDLRGTDFELKVWAALLEIPLGQTCSYNDIAQRLDCPGAARAVGGANGRNPVPLIVPCHRVIGHNKTLTGYGGGLNIKEKLLRHENSL